MTRVASAIVLAATLALAVHSEAMTLCQQRHGELVARAACRRGERAVDLGALGPLGATGAAGAPGTAGAPGAFPLRLVDANGVELGPILRFHEVDTWVAITHPLLGQAVQFSILPDGYYHYTRGAITEVYYQTTDCSGIPYIQEQSGAVIAQVYGDSAYFSVAASSDRTFTSVEVDPAGGACGGSSTPTSRGTCCSTTSGMTTSQPAVRVALSALGFSPPFRAEAR